MQRGAPTLNWSCSLVMICNSVGSYFTDFCRVFTCCKVVLDGTRWCRCVDQRQRCVAGAIGSFPHVGKEITLVTKRKKTDENRYHPGGDGKIEKKCRSHEWNDAIEARNDGLQAIVFGRIQFYVLFAQFSYPTLTAQIFDVALFLTTRSNL